jgi:pimeloyl-ACP methyl ester carboxylesterase
MNAATQSVVLSGPAGRIEAALDLPAEGAAPRGLAVVCHPHPLHGGTMQNKVVQTLARAFVSLGYRCVRFNFRGIGASEGAWDEGRGEIDDALAVVQAQRAPGARLQPACLMHNAPNVWCSSAPQYGTSRWLRCLKTLWSFTVKWTTWCRSRPCSTGPAPSRCR